jgi:hypothetical protein
VVGSYYTDLNGRGFYIYTSPATVTATLSIAAPDGFNWCAHGSDFPPNAIDNGSGLYTLKGTPPFIITTASGNVQVPGYTFAGGEILELTDATGCPGVFCGKDGEAPGLLNCCATGTTDCNGTCKTNGTYTTNDGLCTGSCASAYVQSRDQCGVVKNSKYSTYSNAACADGCGPVYSTACKANIPDGHYVNMGQHVHYWADVAFNDCVSICKGLNAKTWALELWVCEWGSNVQPCYGCHCCS